MRPVRHAGRAVPDEVVAGVGVFGVAYVMLVGLAALIVASEGYDVETAFTTALSAVGNVGPGLGAIGPTETFAHFSAPLKVILSVCMLAGRLELFTLMVLVSPAFWRR